MTHRIEYREERTWSPLSYWVHRQPPGEVWVDATRLEPPPPGPVPGRGYPVLLVEVRGFAFSFASLEEMDHCIEVLGQRHLPSTTRLAREREPDWEWGRANRHWLSRLPGRVKAWRFREEAVRALARARKAFAEELDPRKGREGTP